LKPYPVRNSWARTLQARFTDPDLYEQYTAEFAIWPVGKPAERNGYVQADAQTDQVTTFVVPQMQLVHGTAYGWQARVNDGTEYSPWSKKCFFRYDGVPPSSPEVTSTNYPQDDWTFVFDGHGDTDVAGFQYSWDAAGGLGLCTSGELGQLVCKDPFDLEQTVKADVPGGTATITLNPDRSGPVQLVVRAIDLAGNVSASTEYTIPVGE
jgi:hypothetical protein